MFLTFKHSWRVTGSYINQSIKNLNCICHLLFTKYWKYRSRQQNDVLDWTHRRKDNDSGVGEFRGLFTEVVSSISTATDMRS